MNREVILSAQQVADLEDIYRLLQQEYERVAGGLDFTCGGCPDNCCDSYFLHYTYVEWAYLWRGLKELSTARRHLVEERATAYLIACEKAENMGTRPQVMCPLNEKGLCVLYKHRLLVCRTHGVPAKMVRPDGKSLHFPGCFRCQELVAVSPQSSDEKVDRTVFLRRLAELENGLFNNKRYLMPKVRLTIAQMVVKGPPVVPVSCLT